MDAETRVLYWLLGASKGGPTRLRLLKALAAKPANKRRLALALKLDYKTIQEHLELLEENGVVETPRKGYGSVYFLAPSFAGNAYLKELLEKGENE
ncbi:MAG: winged helix-turn-helix domain-containing protein [Candidatus Micrarchaeia archaeon]